MTIIDLVNEVKEMRHWQREFFRLQGQLKKGYAPVTKQLRDEALAKSKEAEAKVDKRVKGLAPLQIPIPGSVYHSLEYVRKEIAKAKEETSLWEEAHANEQKRYTQGCENELAFWKNQTKQLEALEKHLVALDRLIRKLVANGAIEEPEEKTPNHATNP